jgi:hypothetical protein
MLKSAIQKRIEVVYDYLLWLDPKQSYLLVIRVVGKAYYIRGSLVNS